MTEAKQQEEAEEETPEFIRDWEAPITGARVPRPVLPETPEFIRDWEAPIAGARPREDWRTWKRPACEMSQEEAAMLNCSAIDA